MHRLFSKMARRLSFGGFEWSVIAFTLLSFTLISCATAPLPPAADQMTKLAITVNLEDPVPADEVDDPRDDMVHFLNTEYNGTLSALTFITSNGTYMKLYGGISVSDYTKMHDDLVKLRDYTDIRDVTLMINSPGGSAFTGLSIADLIERAQTEWGFTIHAEASGIVASAAVPVFAVCDKRIASPGTLFMVHEAALWKWPGRETTSDILAQGVLMKKLQERYLDYLVRNSNIPLSEWEKMEKATTWFTVKRAKEIGLVD